MNNVVSALLVPPAVVCLFSGWMALVLSGGDDALAPWAHGLLGSSLACIAVGIALAIFS